MVENISDQENLKYIGQEEENLPISTNKRKSERKYFEKIKYEDNYGKRRYDERREKTRKIRYSDSYLKDRTIKEELKPEYSNFNNSVLNNSIIINNAMQSYGQNYSRYREKVHVNLDEKYLLHDFLQLANQIHDLGHHINNMAMRIYNIGVEVNETDLIAFDVLQPPVFELPLESDTNLISNMRTISSVISKIASNLPMGTYIFTILVSIWHFRKSKLPSTIGLNDLDSLIIKSTFETLDESQIRMLRKAKKNWWIAHTSSYMIIQAIQCSLEQDLIKGRFMEATAALKFLCELANLNVIDVFSLLTLIQQLIEIILTSKIVYFVKFMLYHILKVLPAIQHPDFLELVKLNSNFNLLKSIIEPFNFDMIEEKSDDLMEQPIDLVRSLLKKENGDKSYLLSPIKGENKDILSEYCSLRQCINTLHSLYNIDWKARFHIKLYHHEKLISLLNEQPHALKHHVKLITVESVYTFIEAVEKQHMQNKASHIIGEALESSKFDYENVSVGLNGNYRHYYIKIFTKELITFQLGGVLPIFEHEYWQIKEIVLSTLHAFRHSVELCAPALLKIPIHHDQFEISLIEIILNEMFILPLSSECTMFYCRLIQAMAILQTTLPNLIKIALKRLFDMAPFLDIQCINTLSTFMSYWLSYQTDTAEALTSLNLTEKTNFTLEHEYLLQTMFQKLSQLMFIESPDAFPEWAQIFIPSSHIVINCDLHKSTLLYQKELQKQEEATSKADEKAESDFQSPVDKNLEEMEDKDTKPNSPALQPSVRPLEYVFLRRVLITKARSETHRKAGFIIFKNLLFNVFLNKKKLSALPDESYFENLLNPDMYSKLNNIVKPEPDAANVEMTEYFINEDGMASDDDNLVSKTTLDLLKYEHTYDEESSPWDTISLLELVVKVFLGQGSKSIFHFHQIIDLYHDMFELFYSELPEILKPRMKTIILETVATCWQSFPLRLQTVLDVLISKSVLTMLDVQHFVIHNFKTALLITYTSFDILTSLARESIRKLYQSRITDSLIKKNESDTTMQQNDLKLTVEAQNDFLNIIDIADEVLITLTHECIIGLLKRIDSGYDNMENKFFREVLSSFILSYGRIFINYLDEEFLNSLNSKMANQLIALKLYSNPSQTERYVKS